MILLKLAARLHQVRRRLRGPVAGIAAGACVGVVGNGASTAIGSAAAAATAAVAAVAAGPDIARSQVLRNTKLLRIGLSPDPGTWIYTKLRYHKR